MAVKQYLVGDQDLLSRGLNSACLTILLQIFSALQLPPTADHGVLSFFSQGKCTHLKGFSSPHISRAACFTSTKQILVADPARPHKRTAWHKLNASPGTSFQHLPKHLSPLDESSVQQLLVGTLQERWALSLLSWSCWTFWLLIPLHPNLWGIKGILCREPLVEWRPEYTNSPILAFGCTGWLFPCQRQAVLEIKVIHLNSIYTKTF